MIYVFHNVLHVHCIRCHQYEIVLYCSPKNQSSKMNIFIFLCLSVIVNADDQTQKNRSFTKSLKTRNSSTTPKRSTKNESLPNTIKAFRIRPRLLVKPEIRMFHLNAIKFRINMQVAYQIHKMRLKMTYILDSVLTDLNKRFLPTPMTNTG